MRTDIPRGQRMTRTMGSASLGRARFPAVRRTLALAALLVLAAPAVASAHVDATALLAAARPPAPIFAVSGHGWGHGVGMGQYGTYGYPKHGVGYRSILAPDYP